MGLPQDPPMEDSNSSSLKPSSVVSSVKPGVNKFPLIPEFLKVRGLVREHIESFDYFVNTGIKRIVEVNNLISTSDPSVFVKFTDVKIGSPLINEGSIDLQATPHLCRLWDRTYAAPIEVTIEYCNGSYSRSQRGYNSNVEVLTRNKVRIGRIPIMLRSRQCVLYGKNEAELAQLGECPLDPGGYFVVKGTEKVILVQEQLSNNRIIIDINKKGNLIASVTSSTAVLKSKTVVVMEKEKIYLELNKFNGKIPIMVIMKAMGMECNQEVIQMVGSDPCFISLLLPSIEDSVNLGIYSRQQALEFLETKVKRSRFQSPTAQVETGAIHVLSEIFLAHVPVQKNNLRPKCVYTAVMLKRLLEAYLSKDSVDDKDYVGNKRFELSGQLISILFEDLFKSLITSTAQSIENCLKTKRSSQLDVVKKLRENETLLTGGLERALSTGNWILKRFGMDKKSVSQVLQRMSFIGSMGHVTRIDPQFEKSRKVSGPRALQPSQWGMLCPCDTPEGEQCGLVKNLALMAHVTTDEEEGPIKALCYCLGVIDLEVLSSKDLHSPSSFIVMLNGNIVGKHSRPQAFAKAMRSLRRAGKIGEFVSIFVHEKQGCVYIASDGGRVCRPLVIADKGVSRIKDYHMKELMEGVRRFDDFLHDGLIEYLDVNEENNALIALYEADATSDKCQHRSQITHIEIEPFTILGVIAGLIPYPHHNQSPRNTYQCAMGKQAMGNIAYNQLNRADTLLYLLVYPQKPLLTTRTIELVKYDKLGAGQNATVAVMSYSGYDIEDAIVMNKASLDRGFGRCIVLKKKSVVLQKYENKMSDRVVRPMAEGYLEKSQALDVDGFAAPGEIVRPDDILVDKQSYNPTRGSMISGTLSDSDYKKTPLRHSGSVGQTAVVERVILSNDLNDNLNIKYMMRETRRPEVGDKFSSRHGQKGVCGTIVQQEDFPFTERGICPDLIMNPHGFPSRMTVGKMIELLGSKAGVSCGRFHYGSAFGEPSGHADTVEAISETLVKHGFSYSGKDFIYSGILRRLREIQEFG